MAKETMTAKEISKKILDLKIELLKSPTKRGSIKKEIARLLTMDRAVSNKQLAVSSDSEDKNTLTKLGEKE